VAQVTFLAIILCAGRAIRLGGTRKQLLSLPDGDTLLSRQMRQVHSRGGRAVVVAIDKALQDYALWGGASVFVPERHEWTVETLLSTEPIWDRRRTVVLLGDVLYSKPVMDDICSREINLAVWSNQAEVFALSFTDRFWTGILLGLHETVRLARDGVSAGKLRSACQVMFPSPHGVLVGDHTRDFDLPEHVRAFRREVVQQNRLDDLREKRHEG